MTASEAVVVLYDQRGELSSLPLGTSDAVSPRTTAGVAAF
jgi:hypothetical protein